MAVNESTLRMLIQAREQLDGIEETIKETRKMGKEVEETADKTKRASKQMNKDMKKTARQAQKSHKKMQGSMEMTQEATEDTSDEMQQMARVMRAKSEQAENAIEGIQKQMIEMSAIAQTVSKKVRAAISKMKAGWVKLQETMRTVRNAALKLFTALVAFTGIPIALYAKFQREMSNVNTLMGKSREELKQYEDQVMQLSNQTGKSATELSKGLYDVVSAGVDSSNSMAVLATATKAAQAGVTEVNTAVKAGVSTINAYNKDISELTDVYDLQFSTVKEGIITYEELSNSIGMVLPPARNLGVELDEVYGSISFLTKQGQNAERATTALARAFEGLSDKSDKIKETFGVNIFDSEGRFKGFQETIKGIADELQGLSTQEQLAQLQEVGFEQRAARAIIPAIKNYDQFKDVLGEVANSSGAMKDAHKEATDNIMYTAKQTWQTVVNQIRQFGSTFEDEIRTALKQTQAWITTIGNFAQENKEAIKSLSLFGLKAAAVITVVSSLGTALFALATPMGMLTAGIAAVAAAWYVNLYDIRGYWNDTLKPLLEKGWDVVLNFAGTLWENIKEGNWDQVFSQVGELAVKLVLATAALSALKATLLNPAWLVGSTAGAGFLGIASIGIQLKEAMNEGSFDKFGANMVAAIAAGLGIGAFTGSPQAGMLAFTIALNIELGEMTGLNKIKDWFHRNKTVKNLFDFSPALGTSISAEKTGHDFLQDMDEQGRFKTGGMTGNAGTNEIAGVVHGQELKVA